MTGKELDDKLYGVDCDFEMIESDISILIEQLRYDKREMAKITEELKNDRILCGSLRGVVYKLDNCVGMLSDCLSRYRNIRSDIEDTIELSRRLAKGGIENNESK